MNLDVSQDHLSFDNSETVTVTLRRSPPVQLSGVPGVLRRGFDAKRHAFDGIAVRTGDTIFNLPSAALPGQEIRPGDALTDTAGTTWQILAASLLTFRTRWRCLCRRALSE